MELRKCEDQVNELRNFYVSIQNVSMQGICLSLPDLPGDDESPKPSFEETSLESVVDTICRLENLMLKALPPLISKFRNRLSETDAVTGKPRYGEKTQTRVTCMIQIYDAIHTNVSTTHQSSIEELKLLHQTLRDEKHQEQATQKQVELEKQKQREEQERKRLEEEKLKLERERREEEVRKKEEEAILHQQAELARQARLLKEQQEREWYDCIKKGKEGVEFYLNLLKQYTTSQQETEIAFNSLLRIFQQINAHPEETKFRRIRRNHEQFLRDVGRHEGGIQVLIAAGFQLGAIDDVPCYISKEPDIEKNMDGWSAWFDLNKQTLQILEQAVQDL